MRILDLDLESPERRYIRSSKRIGEFNEKSRIIQRLHEITDEESGRAQMSEGLHERAIAERSLSWLARRRPPEDLDMVQPRVADAHLRVGVPHELAAAALVDGRGDARGDARLGPLALGRGHPEDPVLGAGGHVVREGVAGKERRALGWARRAALAVGAACSCE